MESVPFPSDKGPPSSEMLRCVCYMGVEDDVRAHPGFRNMVMNNLCFSVDEVVY